MQVVGGVPTGTITWLVVIGYLHDISNILLHGNVLMLKMLVCWILDIDKPMWLAFGIGCLVFEEASMVSFWYWVFGF